jgi:hypothetical protein
MFRAFCLLLVVCLAAGRGPDAQAQTGPASCAATGGSAGADADLYCIELLPASEILSGSGTAYLLPPSSPFGVAVTSAGEHIYNVQFELRDLPDPQTLGPYSSYVAWATTPQLDPVVKLGEVHNGSTRLGRVAFDRTLILVTAEKSSAVAERSGRLVLRGTSASMRMQPHDLAFLLAGLIERPDTGAGTAGQHVHHDPNSTEGAWTPPPMHPAVSMPPALMTLRPDVSPYAPRDEGIPFARPRELLRLADRGQLTLVAAPLRRVLFGRTVTMLGFNGQYPGPLIQVDQGATITIRFINNTDFPTAVHWHGVRLDNRFDGVPHVTQDPVPPGGAFEYQVHFRDAGLYWYHPHHREDVLQDLGLYGNMLVRSRDAGYFGPSNREEVLMLDDLLIGDAGPVAHGLEAPTHALMGRFGNVLLVNGEPKWTMRVDRGEVVRFFFTNVASTRVFNLSFRARPPGSNSSRRISAATNASHGPTTSSLHPPKGSLSTSASTSRVQRRSSTACGRSITSRRGSSRRPRRLARSMCRPHVPTRITPPRSIDCGGMPR